MTLPKPVLDNRTFAQLVAESVGQINRLAPAWTDYNASDPGITLIELIAWLSEQSLYRTDRITPEMSRAFLRLVGVTPSPPTVASTVVLLTTTSAMGIALPDRVQVSDALGAVVFETREPVTVSAAHLAQVLAGAAMQDVTAANTAAFDPAKDAHAGLWQPFGNSPAPGAALYLGFDRTLGTPGAAVTLHVWTPTPDADAATVPALKREWDAEKSAAERDCPPDQVSHLPPWGQHYSAQVVWEYFAGGTDWKALPDLVDETRALSLTGFAHFTAPADHVPGGPGPYWFIRCRLVKGGFPCALWIDRIDINAVTAEHAASIDVPETLGGSQGHASERYVTAFSPVVAGSTRLTLTSGPRRDTRWTEMLSWDLVGPHDLNYVLEPERGRITAGNGMRGAVLLAGWDVMLEYRVGGGVEGNIPAEQLTGMTQSGWNAARIPGFAAIAAQIAVEQPYTASGGGGAEALPAAEVRALAELTAPTKTVTLDDFAVLARTTPGVPVARAKALANHHPALPCFDAPGSVTVIVVPDCPGPAPMPDAGFLRSVERYLHRRRPATTELHVIAPHYVKVSVAVKLQIDAASDPAQVASLAQQALDTFFNPLHGGPEGSGWPVGRPVYRTEVMTILAALTGVLTVSALTFAADGGPATCDNLVICAGDLVQSTKHSIDASISAITIFNRSKERECS